MASRRIADLCPELQPKAVSFLAMALEEGIDVLIYCTWRSEEEQLAEYAKGRTKPGRIVTWVKQGKHNCRDKNGKPASKAWDCVPVVNGKLQWDDHEAYLKLAAIGKKLGLRWGGDWNRNGKPFEKGEFDSPHFELIE